SESKRRSKRQDEGYHAATRRHPPRSKQLRQEYVPTNAGYQYTNDNGTDDLAVLNLSRSYNTGRCLFLLHVQWINLTGRIDRSLMDNRKQLKGHDSHESHELMLQSRQGQMVNAHPYPETGPVPIQSTDDFAFLIEFARILWKRKWVVVLMVLVGAVTA